MFASDAQTVILGAFRAVAQGGNGVARGDSSVPAERDRDPRNAHDTAFGAESTFPPSNPKERRVQSLPTDVVDLLPFLPRRTTLHVS